MYLPENKSDVTVEWLRDHSLHIESNLFLAVQKDELAVAGVRPVLFWNRWRKHPERVRIEAQLDAARKADKPDLIRELHAEEDKYPDRDWYLQRLDGFGDAAMNLQGKVATAFANLKQTWEDYVAHLVAHREASNG